MRYRDVCCIAIVMMLVIFVSGKANQTIQDYSFASVEINREDANRESSIILSTDQWVEFQIQSEANGLRLLTNVALDSNDAPDHDLDNPRTGWRYSVDYELLDSTRKVLKQSTYHFRSQVHQLIDVTSGEPIYPIFFGKSSRVATQTRAMQLPINQDAERVALMRVRVAQADPKIQEVVARVLVRSEREDYDQRTTWNRMSTSRREGLSRFCVYDHDLLTIGERNNLLRWQWKSAPVISDFEKRYLFFIGDIDDQQVRGDQLPAGLFIDSQWLGTIPVPEVSKKVRLELRWVGTPHEQRTASATVLWTGADVADRNESFHHVRLGTDAAKTSELFVDVDGGLIQVSTDAPVVVRAFVPSDDLPQSDSTGVEVEITPEMNFVRTFLSDTRSIQYGVTHLDDQPTPMRVVVRYPYARLFSNLGETIGGKVGSAIEASRCTANWQFLREDGSVANQGHFTIVPTPSAYDRFTVAGQRELISDPNEWFMAVPADVTAVRISSPDCRLLVSAYVRPANLRSTVQIPEDYHAFNRTESTRQTWYGMNPSDHESMIQENRSFIVQAQTRPAQPNEEILAGRYEWEGFVPNGNWIARPMLVPRGSGALDADVVRESAVGSVYYEIKSGAIHHFADHADVAFPELIDTKIAFVSEEAPGRVSVEINGRIVNEQTLRSARGEILLDTVDLGRSGTIKVETEHSCRLFLVGKSVAKVRTFVRRTAQRLSRSLLDFQYTKSSHEDELVTLQLFRSSTDEERCRIQVDIDRVGPSAASDVMLPTWTVRRKEYDLRAQQGHDSVLLGHADQVDVGYRCFIRLDSDLPPGTYQIRVKRMDEGQEGYALLYQVVAGQRPGRTVRIDASAGVGDGN
ncbi:hypothetical protein [Planctomycetes bacterium K23_9]|uniref:Uncharacterized protein n=1 Tax=Stieleria marina TaxID=1930275 RepID=A0A517NYF3_9BACT|nr:hypothetical protein K239x_41520 [Planctomycetes bacterium K23_9]